MTVALQMQKALSGGPDEWLQKGYVVAQAELGKRILRLKCCVVKALQHPSGLTPMS
jgi:hypothetical protein